MKKLISAMLCLAMCLSLFVGCSSVPEESLDSDTISSEAGVSENSNPSSSGTSDEESMEVSSEELPDGAIKDAISSAAVNLQSGTASGELMFSSEIDNPSVSVKVEINSASYEDKDEIAENFVSFAEELCSACEIDFPYSSLGFSLYVDDDYVALLTTSLSNGHFYAPLGVVIMDDDYSQLDFLVEYSSYFAAANENSSLEGFIEYFNSDTTTEVSLGSAIIHIPIEEVTADNIYAVAKIFYDEEESTDLYMEMEVSRAYSKLDRYVFDICTTDQEQVVDFIFEYSSDEMLDFETDVEYNEKYAKEIAEFSDMV